jgi:hypothetical protein
LPGKAHKAVIEASYLARNIKIISLLIEGPKIGMYNIIHEVFGYIRRYQILIVNGNLECEFYTFLRIAEAKNTTIG